MFRIPVPHPLSSQPVEQKDDIEDPRLLNLRDRHPEMFTTRLGKKMPKNRRGQGKTILGLSRRQLEIVRTSIHARHV